MKIRNFVLCVLLVGTGVLSGTSGDKRFFQNSQRDIIFDDSESLNPSPVKADNGDLICCFGETGDAAPGGRLRFVRSTDDGETWNETPYLIITSRHGAVGSVYGYISKAPNGTIVLALTDVNAASPLFWKYTSDIKIYISTDNGQSFSSQPLAVVPTIATNGNSPSNPVRFLSNGDWILPGYYRNNDGSGTFPCGFWRSTDSGATWTAHELAFPTGWSAFGFDISFGEPDIVERTDHSLLAVARTDSLESGFAYSNGQLLYTESFDYGHTWTTPQLMGIPGHSPSLIRWWDGTIMLGCRRLSASGNWTSVYIAEDGVNFQFAFDAVDPRGHRNSGTGYPVFTELNSKDIYMAYYAGDTTLPWVTYCAGNVIHNIEGPLGCGDTGYLLGDLNNDCRVDLKDFASLGALFMKANDVVRPSADFTGPAYEGTTRLSAAPIPWDFAITNTALESQYCTVEGGSTLHIDEIPGDNLAWYLPGEYGALAAPAANRHYTQGVASNPWNPNAATVGYTVEMRLQMLDVVVGYGVYGFALYFGEGSGGNGLYDVEFFKDKIMLGDGVTTLYTGDLTDAMHTIRILRYPGNMNDPSANPYIEFYVDGVKVFTGGRDTGWMVNAAYDQDWFYLGGIAGPVRADVKIDYIRTDFTGVYPSIPVCGDTDCVIDLSDVEVLANGWLLCSDPTDPSCLNCNDPANAEYCW